MLRVTVGLALHFLDFISGTVFFLLTIVALISIFIPILYRLSLHGKSLCISNKRNGFSRGTTFLVHKSRFLHFYITGLVVCSSLLYFSLASHKPSAIHALTIPVIPYAFLVIHLLRRAYECIYVHSWSQTGHMHLCGYLLGLCHYILLPFVFSRSTPLFPKYLKMNIWVWIGISLNVWGQVQQYIHHRLLAQCRLRNPSNEQTKEYVIPKGKGFDLITCPHYLAEIIIYLSFTILLHQDSFGSLVLVPASNRMLRTNICFFEDSDLHVSVKMVHHLMILLYQFKTFSLLLWVLVNLSISAVENHNYYKTSFMSEYPCCRKRLIPFIW